MRQPICALCVLHVLHVGQATDSSPARLQLRREGQDLTSRLSKLQHQNGGYCDCPFDIELYKQVLHAHTMTTAAHVVWH
jgi:hypothetical protein